MSEASVKRLYIGTYTSKDSEGVYTCTFDAATGTVSAPVLAAKAQHPTFLAAHPRRPMLYAVCDAADAAGKTRGHAVAFESHLASGELVRLAQEPTQGGRACHVCVDAAAGSLLFADYGGGTAGVLPLDDEGRLEPVSVLHRFGPGSGIDARRQEAPHAHSINLDPENRFAYVPDLGGDRIYVFAFDAEGHDLRPAEPAWIETAPGAGPRHMAFHPHAPYVFTINELDSTIVTYRREPQNGSLEPVSRVSTLPEGFEGHNDCADIHVSSDGRFVYGSNRGHESIVVYRFSPETGLLSLVQRLGSGGLHPRNFALDPTEKYILVANMNSDNIVVFSRDAAEGKLRDTGHRASVSMPVCLVWGGR